MKNFQNICGFNNSNYSKSENETFKTLDFKTFLPFELSWLIRHWRVYFLKKGKNLVVWNPRTRQSKGDNAVIVYNLELV